MTSLRQENEPGDNFKDLERSLLHQDVLQLDSHTIGENFRHRELTMYTSLP